MATKGANQKTRKSNPMLTKNGNPRLGPLNIAQLSKLLDGARKKHIPKIYKGDQLALKYTQHKPTEPNYIYNFTGVTNKKEYHTNNCINGNIITSGNNNINMNNLSYKINSVSLNSINFKHSRIQKIF